MNQKRKSKLNLSRKIKTSNLFVGDKLGEGTILNGSVFFFIKVYNYVSYKK